MSMSTIKLFSFGESWYVPFNEELNGTFNLSPNENIGMNEETFIISSLFWQNLEYLKIKKK